jgi:hypothetical protein
MDEQRLSELLGRLDAEREMVATLPAHSSVPLNREAMLDPLAAVRAALEQCS